MKRKQNFIFQDAAKSQTAIKTQNALAVCHIIGSVDRKCFAFPSHLVLILRDHYYLQSSRSSRFSRISGERENNSATPIASDVCFSQLFSLLSKSVILRVYIKIYTTTICFL